MFICVKNERDFPSFCVPLYKLKQTSRNMRKIILSALLVIAAGTNAQQSMTVSVSNPSKLARTDQPVVIKLASYGDIRSALIKTSDGQEIPLPTR